MRRIDAPGLARTAFGATNFVTIRWFKVPKEIGTHADVLAGAGATDLLRHLDPHSLLAISCGCEGLKGGGLGAAVHSGPGRRSGLR